jgi:hypothetical protein
VPLVRVAGLVDAAFELDAAALMHEVRGLVRRGVKAGLARERDVVAGRVRLGADRAACGRGVAADVSLDPADIVTAEQPPDRVAVRERGACALDAMRGDGMDASRRHPHAGGARRTLHRRARPELLAQRPLADDRRGSARPERLRHEICVAHLPLESSHARPLPGMQQYTPVLPARAIGRR